MADVTPMPDGPLKVTGATLTGADGAAQDAPDPMFLCRCGQSGGKPFCDGSHTKAGFKS